MLLESMLDALPAVQHRRGDASTRCTPTRATTTSWSAPTCAGAWQLSHHSLPEGLQVLHLCDHPWCVRPTHLVLGSPAANVADRLRKQWVRVSSRPRHPGPPPPDAYQIATQVRARHRALAAAAGQQLALF